VTLNFDALIEQYTWVTLGVRAGGRWLGVRKLQGPILGPDNTLTLKLIRSPKPGQRISVEFGLQLGDACPQLGGGTAEFKTVRVES
jgi:hypothetical protein